MNAKTVVAPGSAYGRPGAGGDQRALAICQSLITTGRAFTPTQLQTEPAFAPFLGSLTNEGSSTLACRAPAGRGR